MKYTIVLILVAFAASTYYSGLARADNYSLICEATNGNGTRLVQVDTANSKWTEDGQSSDATITETTFTRSGMCGSTTINRQTGEMVVKMNGQVLRDNTGSAAFCGSDIYRYLCHRNRNGGFFP